LIERVTHRIIQSGNIIEVYEYSKGYLMGYELTVDEIYNRTGTGSNFKDLSLLDDIDSRERSLKRAKANLRRLINANVGQYGKEFKAKFLTLTFRKNIKDLDIANYEFEKFIKRLNYYCFGTKKANLKYTCVVEFQKRGAIHYHVIVYNMPYLKANDIANVWGNGFIKINKIDDINNVGAYVGEYLGQAEKGQGQNLEDDRLRARKSYFSSRGLFKPVEITNKKMVEAVAAALPIENLTYTATFENEYLGSVTYKQYNLKKLVSKG